MKNSFLIALVAFATAGIISCTKTAEQHPYFPPPPPVEQSRTVASSWTSMEFSEMTNDDGTIYLQADARLDGVSDADPNHHSAFAYIKMEDAAGVISYQRVPFNISDATEDLAIGYSIDNGLFSIRVDNLSTTGATLTADRFQNCQFRLIMVSSTDLASMQVDWDDYLAVEDALHHLEERATIE
jgi:hypothetical protein